MSSEAVLSRRLKPVKDLSVLIIAPRKHDQHLWADLLKNCGIAHPLSMSNVEEAAVIVGSGQVDVVFVDESYGPQGIANILIPARNVEFSGGRGVCLILCAQKATMQDVMNARKLGFASLVILPVSTGTIQKHLELAARYIPMSDEELGWSIPKAQDSRDNQSKPDTMSSPQTSPDNHTPSGSDPMANPEELPAEFSHPDATITDGTTAPVTNGNKIKRGQTDMVLAAKSMPKEENDHQADLPADMLHEGDDEMNENLIAPGRNGQSVEDELVFL